MKKIKQNKDSVLSEVRLMRRKTKTHTDRRVFTRTAAETKSVNIGAKIMRGGIRF